MLNCIQFWDKPQPPEEVRMLIEEWRQVPGLNHQLFCWEEADALIKDNFTDREVKAFRACKIPAMQADFFRYCAIFLHGGMYIDADIAPGGTSLPHFVDQHPRGLLMTRQDRVANDFFFFRNSEDPLLQKVIDIACGNIISRKSNDVWKVTGPGILTNLLNRPEGKELSLGLGFLDIADAKKYFRFVWEMEYKKNNTDWRVARMKSSIFEE